VRQPANPLLGGEQRLITRALVSESEDQVTHRDDGYRSPEGVLLPEYRVRGDEASVTPAHHGDTVGIDLGDVPGKIVDCRDHIVDLIAPVVDRVVMFPSVAGAPTVLRRDHDIAARHRLPNEGQIPDSPVAMDAAMNPHQRRVGAQAIRLERSEQIGGDLHRLSPASIDDLLEAELAHRSDRVDAVRDRLVSHVPLVIPERVMVFRKVAHVELSRSSRIDRDATGGCGLSFQPRRHHDGDRGDQNPQRADYRADGSAHGEYQR
jgi:hypothetical protein